MFQITIGDLQEKFLEFNKDNVDICFLDINESIGRVSQIIKLYDENLAGKKEFRRLTYDLTNIINNLIHISNVLDIDLENSIKLKEEYNSFKYSRNNFISEYSNNLTIENFQKAIYTYEVNRKENKKHIRFMYKLIEEVGELSKVIKDNIRISVNGSIKGTIEEELHDVFYYSLCLLSEFNLNYDYSLLSSLGFQIIKTKEKNKTVS